MKHLDAVPPRELCDNWLRPYEAEWASGLVELRRRVEVPERGGTMTSRGAELSVVDVEMEIPIEAPRERVGRRRRPPIADALVPHVENAIGGAR